MKIVHRIEVDIVKKSDGVEDQKVGREGGKVEGGRKHIKGSTGRILLTRPISELQHYAYHAPHTKKGTETGIICITSLHGGRRFPTCPVENSRKTGPGSKG